MIFPSLDKGKYSNMIIAIHVTWNLTKIHEARLSQRQNMANPEETGFYAATKGFFIYLDFLDMS